MYIEKRKAAYILCLVFLIVDIITCFDLRLNINKYTYRVGVKIPKLMMEGEYDIDAKILVVPIKGSGKFRANASESQFDSF